VKVAELVRAKDPAWMGPAWVGKYLKTREQAPIRLAQGRRLNRRNHNVVLPQIIDGRVTCVAAVVKRQPNW
jgi:hypothetical protein